MYIAVVLNEKSVAELKNFAKGIIDSNKFNYVTPSNSPLPHHMTINLNSFDDSVNDRKILNQNAKLKIDYILVSEEIGACAAHVCESTTDDGTTINTINTNKHITICLTKGTKPFLSNKLFESNCKKFKCELNLTGIVQEV